MKMPFGPSSKPPKCNFNFIFINKINKFIVWSWKLGRTQGKFHSIFLQHTKIKKERGFK
jgi:hypothetical protein